MRAYKLIILSSVTVCKYLVGPSAYRVRLGIVYKSTVIRHHVDRTGVDFYCAILIIDLIVFGKVVFSYVYSDGEYVVAYRCISYVCEGEKINGFPKVRAYKLIILSSVTVCKYLVGPSAYRVRLGIVYKSTVIRHYVDRTGIDLYCAVLIVNLIVIGKVVFSYVYFDGEYVVAYHCISYVCEG